MTRRPVPAAWVVGGTSVWLAAFANVPLWQELHALGLLRGPWGWALAGLAALVIALLVGAVLSLLAWPRLLRPAAAVLLVCAAAGAHFMASYGVVIDRGMLDNVLQTDWHEAGALLNGRLAITMVLLAGVPLLVLASIRVQHRGWRASAVRNVAAALAALVLAVLVALLCFQPLASAMRNHKQLRYMVNPLNTLYALGLVGLGPARRAPQALVPVGLDAHVAPRGAHPPLLVLVLGETGRSGNFALNGYARDTTPELAQQDVASFRNAWSCGTSTAASVPCMFSPLGRDAFERRERDTENLLDVLRHAGLAVLWVDNQSGCKGVCDRVPTSAASEQAEPTLCHAGECLDAALLQGLDARIAALPAPARERGIVLVLHQMGSHGPAYHARSPAQFKRFTPECASSDLQSCDRAQIVNAYDNSIAYTDHLLASAIRWLRTRTGEWDTGLLYVADHGESLGEGNLYLHGLPYAIAPDVQKHIPWITWLSGGLQRRTGIAPDCLRSRAGVHLTHDNLFHSVLGLMQVETSAYRQALDAYASCASA